MNESKTASRDSAEAQEGEGGMRISGSGIASNGIRAIKERKELSQARMAISCLHDALLAVAKGMLTPEQVKDFFWRNDLDNSEFIGGVLEFETQPDELTRQKLEAANSYMEDLAS